ncbi:MAG: hypothetical protein ACK40K_02195, partial [Raineya sp.]
AGRDISVDNNNNIHISGFFNGTLDFGDGNTLVENPDTFQGIGFYARYTNTGTCMLSRKLQTTAADTFEPDKSNTIGVTTFGEDIYLGGDFYGDLELDINLNCNSFILTALYPFPREDSFIAKYIPYTSNIAMVGSSSICQSSTYTLLGVPDGASVTWNVGNGLSITSQSNTSLTVFNSSNTGTSFIEANIISACGGVSTVRKTITLVPLAVSQMDIQGPTQVWKGEFVTYSINPVAGATGYRWWVVPVNGATSQPIIPYNCSGYFCWGFATGNNGTGTSCTFKVGTTDGQIYVEALGTNACNSGVATLRAVYQATGCPPNGQKCFDVRIVSSPNPTHHQLSI